MFHQGTRDVLWNSFATHDGRRQLGIEFLASERLWGPEFQALEIFVAVDAATLFLRTNREGGGVFYSLFTRWFYDRDHSDMNGISSDDDDKMILK